MTKKGIVVYKKRALFMNTLYTSWQVGKNTPLAFPGPSRRKCGSVSRVSRDQRDLKISIPPMDRDPGSDLHCKHRSNVQLGGVSGCLASDRALCTDALEVCLLGGTLLDGAS